MKKLSILTSMISALTLGTLGSAIQAQDQIRVVGSSTVFPFATAAAEEFGNTTDFKTPIVESTGTGGGLKLFCAGIGSSYPDVANASRRIEKAELELCEQNGVDDVIEIKIGFDGIVLAASKDAVPMQLSLRDLYLALAAQVPAPGTQGGQGNMIENPYKTWKQINPDLPDQEIQVLGPPPTSGTRDAFNELAIEGGCKLFAGTAALKKTDKNTYKALCRGIREDGVFIEAGENDNLIVQKIQANNNALGIFGFSFLDQNTDAIQAYSVSKDGQNAKEPTFEAISNGSYPISRSLFLYVKKAHIGIVPGLQEYMEEIISDNASGDLGYLSDRGLISLPEDERMHYQEVANDLRPVSLK